MSVAGPAKRGIAWALSSNLVNQVFQFGVGIVLARLLKPADFGVFAVTGIFTGLAATVSNVGLGSALVQRQVVEERHRRSMLAANLVSSGAIVLALIAAAPVVSAYFKNPLAGPVLSLTAWNFLLNAASSVSFSMMSRALRFRAMAVIEAVAAAAFGAVAILLAVRGFGVWAIAWAGVAQSAVRAGLMIAHGGWRPALAWDLAALRDLIGFGAGLTVKRFINYSAANVDYFVIGRRLGPDSLGFYTRAYGLMTLPLTQLSRVIMTVLFPAFSRIQDDNRRLVAGYARVVNATALAAFPFLVGLMLVAPAFIHVVYGEQWMPAVLPLQIMCIAGMMKAVSTFVGSIVDAKGKIGAEVRRQLVYLALLVAGTLIGSRWGTVGVAVAVVAASLAMLVMMQSLLGELTGMRWRTYLGALAPALAGSAVMAAAVAGFQALAGPGLGPTSPALLASSTAVGAGTYILFLAAVRFPQVEALRAELTADLRAVRAGRLRARPESAAGDLGAGEAAAVAREAEAAPEPRVRSGAA